MNAKIPLNSDIPMDQPCTEYQWVETDCLPLLVSMGYPPPDLFVLSSGEKLVKAYVKYSSQVRALHRGSVGRRDRTDIERKESLA